MPAQDLDGRAVGVDRLQPGDHAFLAFADDEDRWDILTVFTQQGFARNEKVRLIVDVGHSPAWVAGRVTGGAAPARRALQAGQLVVSNAPRFARGALDVGRLLEGARRRVGTATSEGFSGLRSASEMSLALTPVDHLGQVVEYENAVHAALFRGKRNPLLTALCSWDERLFGETAAIGAVRDLHPVTVLPRLGTLHAQAAGDRLVLTGDSDLASRAEWDRALRALAARTADTLVLDISDLSFFDAHCAGAVLRMAADLPAPRRLEVWCRGAQRRMLQALGARSVGGLSVIVKRL